MLELAVSLIAVVFALVVVKLYIARREKRKKLLASEIIAILAPIEKLTDPQAEDYRKMHEDALRDLDRSIKSFPGLGEAWGARGIVLTKLKRYEEALRDFGMATKLDKNNAYSFVYKGLILTELGRQPEAIETLRKAVDLEPDNPEIRYSLARLYSRISDRESALENLSKAVQLDGKYKALAVSDSSFTSLWDDNGFKALTK